MALAAIDRLDDAVGGAVEHLVVSHHRRRLRRRGWARAYDPPGDGLWCAGDPPPRDGNDVRVLVDGEEALAQLERDITSAEHSVLLAGWAFEASFQLTRGGPTLRDLLAVAAARVEVRVLAWAGAPLPLFRPSRTDVREIRRQLVRGTRIDMALDANERPLHCHHEKLAVIDGRTAYVGGIDLTSLAGNRLDASRHPVRDGLGWHDATSRIEGPLVADVAAHVALRWRQVTGRLLDAPGPVEATGDVCAQFVRTVPNNVYDALPRGEFRILEAYLRALRSAERLVYLENQFLWSPEVVSILARKLREPPSDEFRVVILLPAKPNNGADDTRGQLGVLVDNDRHDRLLACTLYQPRRANPVYVHAKVGIVDDRWLVVGSANLNSHSFYNDTEACMITCDEGLARSTRERLWSEHAARDHLDGEPHEIVDGVLRPAAEDPRYDRLALLPNVSRRTPRLVGPLNGLLVDG